MEEGFVMDESREIAVPFRFDGDGGVAFVSSDFNVFTQRLRTIVMTAVGERVMLPEFGAHSNDYLFELNDPVALSELTALLGIAIRRWEPGVSLRSVRPIPADPTTGAATIEISYSVAPRDDVLSTVVSVGGSIQEVTS